MDNEETVVITDPEKTDTEELKVIASRKTSTSLLFVIGVISLGVVYVFTVLLKAVLFAFSKSHSSAWGFVATVLVVLVLHQGTHFLMAHLSKAYNSFSLRRFLFDSSYDNPVSINAYFFINIMPFVLLNLLIIILFSHVKVLQFYLALAFVINTAGSVSDLWYCFSISRYPQDSLIKVTSDGYDVLKKTDSKEAE